MGNTDENIRIAIDYYNSQKHPEYRTTRMVSIIMILSASAIIMSTMYFIGKAIV